MPTTNYSTPGLNGQTLYTSTSSPTNIPANAKMGDVSTPAPAPAKSLVEQMNPNLIPGPAVKPGETPKLIVTGSSAMNQFNQDKSKLEQITQDKNAYMQNSSGSTSGTGGTTGTGGTGKTPPSGTDKTGSTGTTDPWKKMKDEATARIKAVDDEAKATLEATKANLSQESQNLIDTINSTYDRKIKAQTEANNMLEGIMRKQGFMGGAVMSASGVQDPALADTKQRNMDRISTLNSERDQLIAKAKIAQNEQDLEASSKYTAALSANAKALNETIFNIAKQAQEEEQQAITNKRNAENDLRAAQDQEIQLAGTLAKGLRAKLQGLDDKTASTIIQKTAKDYNLDPGILMSAYSDYDLTASGKESVMASREATQKLAEERLALQKEKADNAEGKLPPVGQAVGNIVQRFKDKMAEKGWGGISRDDYNGAVSALKKNYGGYAVTELDKQILTSGPYGVPLKIYDK